MAKLPLTADLRDEYELLFETCTVRKQYQPEIDRAVDKMIKNKALYGPGAKATGVPWTLIAVLHELECSQSFTRHLHNGDPLSAKTVQVPKNRPPGSPPWTWDFSAEDALKLEGWPKWTDWSVAGTLYKLESYNGLGYRLHHPTVLTPYLWSYSNHYSAGKYISDKLFSPTQVSKQPGTAMLLRRLAERGESAFTDQPAPKPSAGPLVVSYMRGKPSNPDRIAEATNLQTWLNTHPGVFVKVDGWAGEKTSDAYKFVTGNHLPGDPRGP